MNARLLTRILQYPLVAVFSLPLTSSAQSILFDPDPPVVSPIHRLTIADLDFQNATTPKWLFTIGLRTSDGGTLQARMSIRVSIQLPGGESYPEAARVETVDPHFAIEGNRTITNLDLGHTIPTGPTVYDQVARSRLEQLALPGGTLPAGLYQFVVEASVVNDVNPPRVSRFSIDVMNPSSVELLFPLDGDDGINRFPLFQWRYDGETSRIAVFEKLPTQGSLEEAITGTPHLTQEVRGLTLQYPQAGVRSLEQGKTYVWYVEGLIPESGGTNFKVRSPLRAFTVTPQGLGSLNSLLDELEAALGPKYKSVFDEIRNAALSPEGAMRLNGNPVTSSDLAHIIRRLRDNPQSITSVVLE